jgi:hypothetical protein
MPFDEFRTIWHINYHYKKQELKPGEEILRPGTNKISFDYKDHLKIAK